MTSRALFANPLIEVVLAEDLRSQLRDRYEMPIFFIVGGVDDAYLTQLVGQPIRNLVLSRSATPNMAEPIFGVYASRDLLASGKGYARVFPLSAFNQKKWPSLNDLNNPQSYEEIRPSNVEMTWIIRAYRRNNMNSEAEQLKSRLLYRIYPNHFTSEIIRKVIQNPSLNIYADLYLLLSDDQRDYPLLRVIDDLVIQLPKTIGQALSEVATKGCTDSDLTVIKTSLEILSL